MGFLPVFACFILISGYHRWFLASSASLLKGVLGSLTGFTRWQRQYSDLAQPPAGVAHVPPGENQLPTPKKTTKAATSRSRSCQHAPPEVKQTANRDSTRRLEPSVTFYPHLHISFASIDFKIQHHIFLFQCFLRHLGVDPARHLVDVQWCHARLTYKLNSTFSCFGP